MRGKKETSNVPSSTRPIIAVALVYAVITIIAITIAAFMYFSKAIAQFIRGILTGLITIALIVISLYGLGKTMGGTGLVLKRWIEQLKWKFRYERVKFMIYCLALGCTIASFPMFLFYRNAVIGLICLVAALIAVSTEGYRGYYPSEQLIRSYRFMRLCRSLVIIIFVFAVFYNYWLKLLVSYLQVLPVLWFNGLFTTALIWGILLFSFNSWIFYKLLAFLTLRRASSQVRRLLKNSRLMETLKDVEIRSGLIGSPLSLIWRGRKIIFLPLYMLRTEHEGYTLIADELKPILEHEVVHLDLDGEVRWQELRRREELKAALFTIALTAGSGPIWYLTYVLSLLIGVPLDLGLIDFQDMFSIFSWAKTLIAKWFMVTSIEDLGLWLTFGLLVLSSLSLTGNVHAVRFREARADFLAVLRIGDPETYEQALRKAYQLRVSSRGLGPLTAFCFTPAKSSQELQRGEKSVNRLSLRDVAKTKLVDMLWFPRNFHPPLQGRFLVIEIAKALLNYGLSIEFKRTLKEVDYLRFVRYNLEDLPRLRCLLQSMEELCRSKGRFTLRELEDVMAQKGFQFSYSELFGALVFLEDRGIAVVRP